ncbi:DAACS family dicarboxylate/amino acid:cation (Na+ or H+) symporter [Desulfohalotomaculum tongense]|uniref:dicarboxylate/amino acid:cation symporter n=1 Tax=Desulforadius tongensis TaxID=1216062 RepID=UPI0019567613|nr:dicarboxylate/amino acid:cation symporter [Desulforadius tongensis]MBM7855539.1 DAACS family dicarboxylate/amino acid:cation (Na+ or H+) symporter [Desulforadius tongensis]
MTQKEKMGLPVKMSLALIAGVVLGIIVQMAGWNLDFIKPFGDLFIRLIRMIVIPLVFASLVAGAASMGDARKLGSVASKTLFWYFGTTAVAIGLGLFFANILEPGVGLNLSPEGLEAKKVDPPGMVDTLLNIVPINPVQAFAEGNLLQIILFAIFFGFALNSLGERGKPLLNLFELVTETMIKLTNIIMSYAPIGVFALVSYTVAQYGPKVLLPLIKVIAAMYIISAVHVVLVYLVSVKLVAKKNLKEFFAVITEPLLVAFTTCTSAAALPLNMRAVRKLGASKDVSSFVIPLGNTINMDGTAIYLGLSAVFVAQIYGLGLTGSEQLTILLMAVLASIGCVGVPSMGLVVMTMVFTSVNLPLEGIALVAGIDRVLDMARTSLNVIGDAVAALVVSRWEGELGETDLETTGPSENAVV